MTILDLGAWCILRCLGADTLRLQATLATAGMTAWTPIERRHGKMPRTNAPFDKPHPLMPSYVFAAAEEIDDLLRLEHQRDQRYPSFTLFRWRDGIPLIADSELDALRDEEARQARIYDRRKRRGLKGPQLAKGSEIRMPDGPFAGLNGIVEDQQGQLTIVAIPGFSGPIKVASCLLLENMARDSLPHPRAA